MENQAHQQVRDLVQNAQSVAIAVGRNPKLDDMAAALSLSLGLEAMGKRGSVISPTEPIVELSNLVGIDRVRTSFEGDGGDLIVSFPYREGEIEKVSYTIDDGYLNIVVKAGEDGLNFSEQDVKYRRSGGGADLIFVLGVPQLSDLGNLITEEMTQTAKIVNIDNKPQNQNYGDVVLVSPKYSSLSEQVAELLLDMGVDVDLDSAQNLMSGIAAATNNFQHPRTSYVAFEMAAFLMRKGAVRSAQPGGQAQPQQQQQPAQQPVRNEDRIRQELARAAQDANRPTHQQQRSQQQPQRGQRDQHYNQPQRGQQPQRAQQPQRPQQPQPQVQPQAQPQPQQHFDASMQSAPIVTEPQDDKNAPTEWLTPKVYKGSSNV